MKLIYITSHEGKHGINYNLYQQVPSRVFGSAEQSVQIIPAYYIEPFFVSFHLPLMYIVYIKLVLEEM